MKWVMVRSPSLLKHVPTSPKPINLPRYEVYHSPALVFRQFYSFSMGSRHDQSTFDNLLAASVLLDLAAPLVL